MYRTSKFASVSCLVAFILSLSVSIIQAQTGTIVAADRKGAEANAGDDPLDPWVY